MDPDDMDLREDEPDDIEFTCEFVRATAKAMLVIDADSGEELWFPKSQITATKFDKQGRGTIIVTEWIAKQKGLLD